MSERDYYNSPQSVFARIPRSSLTDIEKEYIDLHAQLHADLNSYQIERQDLAEKINNVSSESINYQYLIDKLNKNEEMQESLFKQISELEKSEVLHPVLAREQKKQDEEMLREYKEKELAKLEAVRIKYRNEREKTQKIRSEYSGVAAKPDNNKRCSNCKFYNSERRNEMRQARCSAHPFWVKDDEVCDSFEVTHRKSREKGSIFSAILFSMLGTILFYIIYGLLFLLIGLLLLAISNLPILKDILGYVLSDSSADMFALGISLVVSYIIIGALAEHFLKNKKKVNLSLFLIGIYLLVLNIGLIILNLIFSNSILVNLAFIIAGIVMTVKNRT